MAGQDIAAEVSAALREAALAVGDGEFMVTFYPQAEQDTPYDTPSAAPDPVELAALDNKLREVFVQGSQATRLARILTVEAAGYAPQLGDTVVVSGKSHTVLNVSPLSPAGVVLLYEVEIST